MTARKPAWIANLQRVWRESGVNRRSPGIPLVDRRLARLSGVVLVASLLAGGSVAAEQVVCSYTYGGETRQLVTPPVSSPYQVPSVEVGSYFHFRVVFQNRPADLASIKVYTYADRDEGPVLIHQATYPYPPQLPARPRHGFTGLHHVYEPTRDGELEYWCTLTSGAVRGNRVTR